MLSKYFIDWWGYESFLPEGGNKLGHCSKRLTATTAPYEKIEICTNVSEKMIHILSETRHSVPSKNH